MRVMASQITSLIIVYSTVYSGADHRKHKSSASLAFVRGIHRGSVNSPHKWPVTRKMFPFDDVIMANTDKERIQWRQLRHNDLQTFRTSAMIRAGRTASCHWPGRRWQDDCHVMWSVMIKRAFIIERSHALGPSMEIHPLATHDDVIKWKHFPRYWPFVRGIHRSPVNSPHKGQWRGALMFSLICARINGWVNNREAGDLRRHRAHYDVIVMSCSRQPNVFDHNGNHVIGITWLESPSSHDDTAPKVYRW